MKIKAISLAVAVASAGLSSVASADFTGNLALSSNYVWRGVTQSADDPSISGGFDYSHETGIYVGTWWASVANGTSGVEIDVYGGWSKEFDALSVDIGVIHYEFPGSPNSANVEEVYGGLGYTIGKFSLEGYVWEGIGNDWDNRYLEAKASYQLTEQLSISAHIGDNDGDGGDYNDYKVALGASFLGLDWEVAWVDNDIKGDRTDHFYISVAKEFDI